MFTRADIPGKDKTGMYVLSPIRIFQCKNCAFLFLTKYSDFLTMTTVCRLGDNDNIPLGIQAREIDRGRQHAGDIHRACLDF